MTAVRSDGASAQMGARLAGGTTRAVTGVARSLLTKLLLLVIVFTAVPVILYAQFRDAYRENQELIEKSVRQQGRIVSRALAPILVDLATDDVSPAELSGILATLSGDSMSVRVLYRPNALSAPNEFYFVAASPAMSAEQLTRLRQDLLRQSLLDRLAPSCDGRFDDVIRYRTPAGPDELITSMSAVNSTAGCWVVITSLPAATANDGLVTIPYWMRPEAQSAALIYVVMAIFTFSLLVDVWSSLRRFGRLAARLQRIGTSHHAPPSFAALNQVPELSRVAQEFDRMVAALRQSARVLRRAAEDNTHALKTPIAVIRHSLEPVMVAVPREHARGRGALSRIDNALTRLDGLVSAARRLEEGDAQLITPPRHRIKLATVLEELVSGYAGVTSRRGIHLTLKVRDRVSVLGGRTLIETVVENLLENAIGFTPRGGAIDIELRRHGPSASQLVIEDTGPGVPDRDLPRIFERYYTKREGAAAGDSPTGSHQGIGLWIVRRNIEAIGGTVHAEKPPGGGLSVVLTLPTAPAETTSGRSA